MTTTDVFQRAFAAMASFVAVPLGGEVYSLNASPGDVMVKLEEKQQPAQALLAWLGCLAGSGVTGRRLSHHHGLGMTFVTVEGQRDGVSWDVYATFTGEDAALLCDCSPNDDRGSLSVHRLRMVQERQLSRAVAA